MSSARENRSFSIRRAKPVDAGPLHSLFVESVRQIASRDYNPEQIDAWAPESQNLGGWTERLAAQYTLVAYRGSRYFGFGSIDSDGYIDLLYVSADFQRKGVGKALLRHLEEHVRHTSATKLTALVSLTAQPLFSACGFLVQKAQVVTLRGVDFKNFVMDKVLKLEDSEVMYHKGFCYNDWAPFQSLEGYARLILICCWDPIGVMGYRKAIDEYDAYVGPIVELLRSGCGLDELSQHLLSIGIQQMGPSTQKAKVGETARRLLTVYAVHKDDMDWRVQSLLDPSEDDFPG